MAWFFGQWRCSVNNTSVGRDPRSHAGCTEDGDPLECRRFCARQAGTRSHLPLVGATEPALGAETRFGKSSPGLWWEPEPREMQGGCEQQWGRRGTPPSPDAQAGARPKDLNPGGMGPSIHA